jgi:hypothetical protein
MIHDLSGRKNINRLDIELFPNQVTEAVFDFCMSRYGGFLAVSGVKIYVMFFPMPLQKTSGMHQFLD